MEKMGNENWRRYCRAPALPAPSCCCTIPSKFASRMAPSTGLGRGCYVVREGLRGALNAIGLEMSISPSSLARWPCIPLG